MNAAAELEADEALLDAAESGSAAAAGAFRTWRCVEPVVVIGRGQTLADVADTRLCRTRGIPIVRRTRGGGAVVVGHHSLQYAFAFTTDAHPSFTDIGASKRTLGLLLAGALAELGHGRVELDVDGWGDLVVGDRKVAGTALRRRRRAFLLHGSLLERPVPSLVGAALRTPPRAPAYRGSRSHGEFLGALGPIDDRALAAVVARRVARLAG